MFVAFYMHLLVLAYLWLFLFRLLAGDGYDALVGCAFGLYLGYRTVVLSCLFHLLVNYAP